MLRVGLTGGIGSGKSTVARLLADRGATVADADALAREVVAPGTQGLAKVADAFPGVVHDGALDRAALAEVVFADPARRRALEAITHPLIGARTAELAASVPPGGVFVHDVPLLVELAMAPAYHLVLVVAAPKVTRLARLLERGLPAQQAKERMANQASDADRADVADVVLDNAGSPAELEAAAAELWSARLAPYAAHLAARDRAPRPATQIVPYDRDWARQAANLAAKITAATGCEVEHIGSTAVAGLAAKDVLDLMVAVPDLAAADALRGSLEGAGFAHVAGADHDTPKPGVAGSWEKRFHANGDPGRPANVHVRPVGSPGWRYALAFRDWLRADPAARQEYAALKRRLAAEHPDDYAEAKEPWFTEVWPRIEARATGAPG